METTLEQSRSRGVLQKLYQPVWYWSFAFLLAGFYVASSLYISAHRLLWFDEVFTTVITRQPSLRAMWDALCSGQEHLPPLFFFVARTFDQLSHHADIGIRIPSALALGVALLVTFDIARRLTDGLYGLIAMSFVTSSFVIYYGYEARPYAIYFMLAAIALWLWIFTQEESKAAAVAFGAVFLIGVAVHYYFLLCLVPFAILALLERRIFHPKVIAGAVGILCSLVMLYPQIAMSGHSVSVSGSWAPPSLRKLQEVYLEFFPLAMLPLVLFVIGVIVFGRPRERVVAPMSSAERVSWLFLAIPPAAYILALLVTNYFYNRFIIGTVPGIVVAATCLSWRYFREALYSSLALLVLFCGTGIYKQLSTLRHIDLIPSFGQYQQQTRQMLALEDTLQRDGKRRFVVSSNLLFLEAWYYSKRPDLYWYLLPPGSPARNLSNLASLKFLSTEEIVANAEQTALIDPSSGLIKELEEKGVHLKMRVALPETPQYVFYLE